MGDKIIDSLANRIVELSYEVGGHNDNDENKITKFVFLAQPKFNVNILDN